MNLSYAKIDTKGEYLKVSDLLNIQFVDGKKYTIQILNYATIIIASSKPTAGGFYINNSNPFLYIHKSGADLYIKSSDIGTTINISE